MPQSLSMLPEHYYHIYNRGNNRQLIFLQVENYSFFLKRLQKYFSKDYVDLLAYCLMPNHFHLLVTFEHPLDFPNLMRSFSISYVKAFNRFHHRTGHLFEGDYQAKVVAKESHLYNVIRYIHLNSLFAGLVSKAEDWEYSDYREWIDDSADDRRPPIRLRNELFGNGPTYRAFAEDYAAAKAEHRKIEEFLGL